MAGNAVYTGLLPLRALVLTLNHHSLPSVASWPIVRSVAVGRREQATHLPGAFQQRRDMRPWQNRKTEEQLPQNCPKVNA